MSSDQREQFESGMRQFIQTELETGMTFASIALESSTEETRPHRNRQNARKAYDTAKHFSGRARRRTDCHRIQYAGRLTKLKYLLLELGENV
jgi:hypothetical protein